VIAELGADDVTEPRIVLALLIGHGRRTIGGYFTIPQRANV